jgi:hypothetical protein
VFVLLGFVYMWWCPTHIVLSFCFGFRRLMYPMFPVFVVLCTLCFRCSSSYVPYVSGVRRLVYPMFPVSLDCPFLIASLVFSNVDVFTPQIREAEVNLIPFNTHVHHRSLFCLDKGI